MSEALTNSSSGTKLRIYCTLKFKEINIDMKKLVTLTLAVFYIVIMTSSTALSANSTPKIVWEKFEPFGVNIALAIDAQNNAISVSLLSYAGYVVTKNEPTNGNLLWSRIFQEGYTINSVGIDNFNNIYCAGNNNQSHAYIARLNPDTGEFVWSFTSNILANINDLKISDAGWLTVVGRTASNTFYVAKINLTDGTPTWEITGSQQPEEAVQAAIDPSGNIFVAGRSSQYITRKYDGVTGTLLWEDLIDRGFGSEAWMVRTDNFGNAVVTGYSNASASKADIYTVKYSSNGYKIWTSIIDSGWGWDVEFSSTGDVFLSGSIGTDITALRLSGLNGMIQWQDVYDSGGYDYGMWINVDSNDNVACIGVADGYTTIVRKYSGSDGHLIWNHSGNGVQQAGWWTRTLFFDSNNRTIFNGHNNSSSTSDRYLGVLEDRNNQ